ncbi:TPA: CaiF/GrlA family transcriptional regulator [Klebsiella pneumoniae]|nr:CaiF/GrlA family transcriptional regulator [Klebsiella pneumoniae]HBR1477741.1 CaiF/GrlA family transcriptional regulator [Klebsiella pneumoniae]
MSIRQEQYTTRKHRSFRLPTELSDMEDTSLPLYILVAYWGLRQNKPVTVRDVRQAFCISLRRASDILEYMTEQGSEIVEAECRLCPLKPGDRRMRREWRVTAVYGERARTMRESVNRTTALSHGRNIAGQDGISKLRRWFVTRSPGKTVPDDLIDPE